VVKDLVKRSGDADGATPIQAPPAGLSPFTSGKASTL